ncbi:MAG: aminomethyl-transferring glycine dehydrogenase [Planctomycetota bacterium]
MTTADTDRVQPSDLGAAKGSAGSIQSPGDARAVGTSPLDFTDGFVPRHIGPNETEIAEMLEFLGFDSLESFIGEVVPKSIRATRPLHLTAPAGHAPRGEHELIAELKRMASKNKVYRSCIGMGYSETITPAIIQRNVLENPGWYTQYTPYQAEIAQGRLEALINFQTMIADLTGMEIAGSSLLDEGTAAAEAMAMTMNIASGKPRRFFAAADCHPQTLSVLETRASHMDIELVVAEIDTIDFEASDGFAGILVQYPTTDGRIENYADLAKRAHDAGAVVVAAADPMALALLTPPGEWGADIAVGSAQRFGVPMGFGGPHAGYIATAEKHVRRLPGRLVGVSKDAEGNNAYRLAIQTREQHIRRDRATSNICTAQVLLAVMAGFYGVYHGPTGIKRIASRIHGWTAVLAHELEQAGAEVLTQSFFDTIRVRPTDAAKTRARATAKEINLRDFGDGTFGISIGETVDAALVSDLVEALTGPTPDLDADAVLNQVGSAYPQSLARTSDFMTHEVFSLYDSETELLRYIFELQGRDLSLAHSMIPLGSCTMKLNATSEMLPVTWPEFGGLHPFTPRDQWEGYADLFSTLESWLKEITRFDAISLQPNAGSQGEYAGLLAIAEYHTANNQTQRDVCLIPESAHGTNAASAVMAGMKAVSIKVRPDGAIDMDDLRAKVEKHAETLSALMVTYPSTCGVFEDHIREVCSMIHEYGGQVYMDGANMNAQVGLTSPGEIGADVCHLNLHKTFCIPHGGGGPGMGPIGVKKHLEPYLPGHTHNSPRADRGETLAVSAAPYGSPSILPISWMYIALMGAEGLTKATEVAILSANYMARRLKNHYPVLFSGKNDLCAHEFVIDCRQFKKSAGIEIDDIAKRLMDFGFHAPTMSWPVPGTLMIEPTESEPKTELDRFCNALIAIADEIKRVESGEWPKDNNPLKHAPHTTRVLTQTEWDRPYSRELGAFPVERLKRNKFWPAVSRIDNPYGDRNLQCSCPPMSELVSSDLMNHEADQCS